jgi:class 3 adenylate cyclase
MECGTTLNAGCPNCGFVNQPGAKFCNDCGTVLASNGGSAAPATPRVDGTSPNESSGSGSERKLVSILFADLVGFTPFAEERDAEDVRDTLTRYFDLARDVIERYGGTVEKFIGDAVMAVWGAPIAHEDDAERAVRAGLELVDAVTSLGHGIQARAGILTGEAAVTIGATNQGMVAGDLVNTASRLQSVAPPGTVLVGEATQRATSKAIAFEPAGDQVLKGKQAPVAAWQALRIVAELGGRNRQQGLEPPFIGRADELRLIKDLFHATGREKKLRVVSVMGPAGIGKSRLAWEFSKYLDGLIDDVYWHSGRAPAYGEGISFWALGEMIRERCKLVENDDEATTRARIAETVVEWITDPEERAWIERSLLTLLGLESDMAADQLFGAWRTFFERIAEKGTVALVFEDMHFADAGLLDFIDHLLEWSRGLPIYVVTLARPDLIERRPDWGAGKRNFVSLYLEPLPEEQMRELLAALVPGMPEPAVAAIVGRADGIPLYAVETVRMLVAEGRLVEESGVYVPRGDLTTLAVPETLQALIASRLDGLDELERGLVHDAAVLGQSFTVAALAAVASLPEKDLEARLNQLVRRELLQREMDARSPERGQYAFVQALIREVAYNTLSKKDRKKLHLSAARYFESLGNDELAGALASHYLAAHANAAQGEEADALASQARIALKAGAARASALGSFDQAVTFLQQALAVTAEGGDKVELLRAAADASRISGRTEAAEQMLRDGVELGRKVGDRDQTVRATAELAAILVYGMHSDQAKALAETALVEFADADERVIAELNLTLGRVQFTNADFRASLRTLDLVLETAEKRGLIRLLCIALIARGNSLWGLSRRREAFGTSYVARDLAAEHGLTEVQLRVMGNLANAMTETDLQSALDYSRELMALARKFGQRGGLIAATGNFGYTAFLAGAWDEGLAEMDAFLAEDLSPRDQLIMLNNATIIRAGRGEAVDENLAEMARLGQDMSGKWRLFLADPEANAAFAKGDVKGARDSYYQIATDDPSQGLEYFHRAARAALLTRDAADAARITAQYEELGGYGPVHEARYANMQAGLAAIGGRTKESLALYKTALAGWRATHAVWDEALTGLEMATLLDVGEPDVAAAVSSSRAIFERLGAKPYLAWLDRLSGSRAPAPAGRTARESAVPEVAVTD